MCTNPVETSFAYLLSILSGDSRSEILPAGHREKCFQALKLLSVTGRNNPQEAETTKKFLQIALDQSVTDGGDLRVKQACESIFSDWLIHYTGSVAEVLISCLVGFVWEAEHVDVGVVAVEGQKRLNPDDLVRIFSEASKTLCEQKNLLCVITIVEDIEDHVGLALKAEESRLPTAPICEHDVLHRLTDIVLMVRCCLGMAFSSASVSALASASVSASASAGTESESRVADCKRWARIMIARSLRCLARIPFKLQISTLDHISSVSGSYKKLVQELVVCAELTGMTTQNLVAIIVTLITSETDVFRAPSLCPVLDVLLTPDVMETFCKDDALLLSSHKSTVLLLYVVGGAMLYSPAVSNVGTVMKHFHSRILPANIRRDCTAINITDTMLNLVTDKLLVPLERVFAAAILRWMLVVQPSRFNMDFAWPVCKLIMEFEDDDDDAKSEAFWNSLISWTVTYVVVKKGGLQQLLDMGLTKDLCYPKDCGLSFKMYRDNLKGCTDLPDIELHGCVDSSVLPAPAGLINVLPAPAGLTNIGSTCYANSVLQALAICPTFSMAIVHAVDNDRDSRRCGLLYELGRIFLLIHHGKRRVYRPTDLIELSRPAAFGTQIQQQDCSEYLQHLIESLISKEKATARSGSGNSEAAKSDSSIESICRWSLEISVKCETCQTVSSREDKSTVCFIRFPAPSCASSKSSLEIEDMIFNSLDTGMEKLSKSDQYSCDVCKEKVDAIRTSRVVTTPEVLLLTLCRFKVTNGQGEKIPDEVSFPQKLSFPPSKSSSCPSVVIETGPVQDGGSLGADEISVTGPVASPASPISSYWLRAVIIHVGTSLSSGHYYCYGRQSHSKDSWMCLDDQHVSSMGSFDAVRAACDWLHTPYVLLYERVQPDGKDLGQDECDIPLSMTDELDMDEEYYIQETQMAAQRLPSSNPSTLFYFDEDDDDEAGSGNGISEPHIGNSFGDGPRSGLA